MKELRRFNNILSADTFLYSTEYEGTIATKQPFSCVGRTVQEMMKQVILSEAQTMRSMEVTVEKPLIYTLWSKRQHSSWHNVIWRIQFESWDEVFDFVKEEMQNVN